MSISGEDPTDLAFDLFTNLCKIQSVRSTSKRPKNCARVRTWIHRFRPSRPYLDLPLLALDAPPPTPRPPLTFRAGWREARDDVPICSACGGVCRGHHAETTPAPPPPHRPALLLPLPIAMLHASAYKFAFSTLTAALPLPPQTKAYTTCEGFFLLEEYLDMFDAPVTLVLGSEKVWPLQPTVSYAGL